MSAVDAWLADRRPAAPRELSARMGTPAPGEEDGGDEAVLPALTRRGLHGLDEARRRPGRVRESAYDLLTADALLTYACEAALDAPDPEALLTELMGSAASSDR